MKSIFTFLFFIVGVLTASAQGSFFVYAIEVSPENPTSLDEVTITIHGNFPSTGIEVQHQEQVIDGNDILLNLYPVAVSDVGLTVLVPASFTFTLPPMVAGDYMISVGGTGVSVNLTDASDSELKIIAAPLATIGPDIPSFKIDLLYGEGHGEMKTIGEDAYRVKEYHLMNSFGKELPAPEVIIVSDFEQELLFTRHLPGTYLLGLELDDGSQLLERIFLN